MPCVQLASYPEWSPPMLMMLPHLHINLNADDDDDDDDDFDDDHTFAAINTVCTPSLGLIAILTRMTK